MTISTNFDSFAVAYLIEAGSFKSFIFQGLELVFNSQFL